MLKSEDRGRRAVTVKGSVLENVMFPPDDVRPSERLKAGPGKSDRWRTSRVTKGVNLSSHARRLSAIGTSRRLDGSGPLLALLQETRSLGSGKSPTPSPRTPPCGIAHPAAVSSSSTAPVRTARGKAEMLKTERGNRRTEEGGGGRRGE